MRQSSLLVPFALLGAVEGWLLNEGTDEGFLLRPGTLLTIAISVAVCLVVGGGVGWGLTRGRPAGEPVGKVGVLRLLAWRTGGSVIIGSALALRDGVRLPLLPAAAGIGATLGLFFLPLFLPTFLAWRAAARSTSRRGSLLARAEARGVWIGVCLGLAIMTLVISHNRAFIFDGKVGHIPAPRLGSDVELACAWLAAFGAATVTALDALDLRRVRGLGALLALPHAPRASATLDLGMGDEEHLEAAKGHPSYRQQDAARAVLGDPAAARRALERRLAIDLVVVAATIAGFFAFKR